MFWNMNNYVDEQHCCDIFIRAYGSIKNVNPRMYEGD